MIINLLPICYQPSHDPFATIGPPSCQSVDSEKPASKLIRAVLRVSEMDPQTWTQYSIHKCDCNSKGKGKEEMEDGLDLDKTLDQLGIREGDSIFFKKREDRVDELGEDQEETFSPLSRKRKERDENEATSQSSPLPSAPTPKSYLENLESQAAATARTISKRLGGDAWRTQSIGKLDVIKTKSAACLQALARAVKTSLQIPQVATVEAGLFNSDLVEALIRAFHQRVGSSVRKTGDRHFFNLGVSDYERANELLEGKFKGDGTWERSSLAHLEDSALSKPIQRFPLSDTGLSGRNLNTARAICGLWGNDKWLTQRPLPGLLPISLKDASKSAPLRQIARLTRVKPGEASPDGFPPIALRALRSSIEQLQIISASQKKGSRSGQVWNQKKAIPLALVILKRDLKIGEGSVANSTSSGSSSSSREEGENDSSRRVRRKIGGKK